jgi:ATP-dependent Clp protease adapter protein ClpS
MMQTSGTDTINLTTFKVPKYALVFDDNFEDSRGVQWVLVNVCSYNSRGAIAKVREIQEKGEAVVLTGSKEVINDMYEMIDALCCFRDIRLSMFIREGE